MVDEYIARHPLTGQPIHVAGRERRRKKEKKVLRGPWSELEKEDILPLARGEVDLLEVLYDGRLVKVGRPAGIRALPRLITGNVNKMNDALIMALEDGNPEVRVAAIEVLPTCAMRDSEKLLDMLAELLDDDVLMVRQAASRCLGDMAADFPSGTDTLLHIELRHEVNGRRKEAWRGLRSLCQAWPEVAADHIDRLIREKDRNLRRDSAGLLKKLVAKSGAKVWDLISWSLQDEDDEVRSRAASTLRPLAEIQPRVALLLAESALFDSHEKVRAKVIKCLDRLDSSSTKLRSLVNDGCKVADLDVRKACIHLIPRLYNEDEARELSNELLKQETDVELREYLQELAVDPQLEGDEAKKNTYLAPAEPVPARDLEIMASESDNPQPLLSDGDHTSRPMLDTQPRDDADTSDFNTDVKDRSPASRGFDS